MIDEELSNLLKQALQHYLPKPLIIDPHVLAYRFENGQLTALQTHFHLSLDDLLGIDAQKQKLIQNTRQFLAKLPANHVLMTGSRGVGKSSLIKALLAKYHHDGLRVIEMSRYELLHLDTIAAAIDKLNNPKLSYIIYCDDLAFDSQDENYRTLKTVLDGSLGNRHNLLVYATSNRRHLLPQFMKDNVNIYNGQTDEVNPYEAIDETVSLSDRFGLWLSFYPINQEQYLAIAQHYLTIANIHWTDDIQTQALRFAAMRGGRSGRLAYQFSQDYIGKIRLGDEL